MNESIAIQPVSTSPPDAPRKHSGLGIASFVIGLVTLVMMFGVFLLAVAINVHNGGVAPDEHAPQTVMLGLLVILTGLISLVGLGLGVPPSYRNPAAARSASLVCA
ncbi:hypothetical protein GCM10027285_27510 [Oleiagrimonas citrea]|uniref:Uncharacterized protein n=1 Tax=Oleiagrimonas citrea TaxID=1665687 RepID=A0A846ZN16_9GAMM|nr:hypothetical protein [Oleiagrimonas citrea]NKZ39087.1 hypothetical protein [Oleiagrimonas citrea]